MIPHRVTQAGPPQCWMLITFFPNPSSLPFSDATPPTTTTHSTTMLEKITQPRFGKPPTPGKDSEPHKQYQTAPAERHKDSTENEKKRHERPYQSAIHNAGNWGGQLGPRSALVFLSLGGSHYSSLACSYGSRRATIGLCEHDKRKC